MNPNRPRAVELGRHIAKLLESRAELVPSPETEGLLATGRPATPLESMAADALVAIGGDGTFLSALQKTRIPLLPLNAGHVGFLAEVEGENLKAVDGAIERLLRGLYSVEERMTLSSALPGLQLPDAVNEVVVHTSQVAKMREFEIGIDHKPIGRLRADGLILATPTGSTSYSLSALGPIVDPNVEGIVITALAPFQATQRAVVVDPLRTVSVTLVQPDKDGVVVVDGQSETRLAGGGRVIVYRSPRKAFFVRFGSRFFRRLQGKKILPWSEEVADTEESELANLPPPA